MIRKEAGSAQVRRYDSAYQIGNMRSIEYSGNAIIFRIRIQVEQVLKIRPRKSQSYDKELMRNVSMEEIGGWSNVGSHSSYRVHSFINRKLTIFDITRKGKKLPRVIR